MLTSSLLDTAIAVADSVLNVDGDNPGALETRGTVRFYRLQRGLLFNDSTRALADVSLAERDLTKAVRIAPRQASAWSTLSLLRGWKNNVVGEDEAAQRSDEEDPQQGAPDVAYTLWAESFDLGLFADAEHWCSDAHARYPSDYRFVRCQLVDILVPGARVTPAMAWAWLDTLNRLAPTSATDIEQQATHMLVAVALARAGLRDSADAVIRASQRRDGALLGYEAIIRLQLGEPGAALSLLEAYIRRYPEQGLGLARRKTWLWRDLEQNPRFRAITSSK
jgi:tetratricopeptide (TPR) repeat protein